MSRRTIECTELAISYADVGVIENDVINESYGVSK
jgi:hypothetical protein